MMNITVDDRKRPLTGIEKLQLIEKIRRENDPQKKVDAIVLATQICIKESRQAKVDDIVAKTKLAMDICKKESWQARVDGYIEETIAGQKKNLTGIERLQLLKKIKEESDQQEWSAEEVMVWLKKYFF